MYDELEYEYGLFLEDMERNEPFCRYIDKTDYEDEYSHNEIDEYQEKFVSKVREWLHKNKPNKYIASGGWCVFVMTIEEAEKRNIRRIEDYIVR